MSEWQPIETAPKDRPLFHRITKKERERLIRRHATWGEIMERYRQPDWCSYPEALAGIAGCWSLVQGLVRSRKICRDCELYRDDPKKA